MNDNVTELEFRTTESTTSNITVNGVPVEQKVKVTVALCKNCNNILVQFEPNTSLKDRIEYIQQNLKGNLNYCPTCGYKINYTPCEIINAEAKLIREE